MVDSFVVVAYIEYSIIILIFGYAAYWALTIRHALVGALYRNQAFGTGLIAAIMTLTIFVVAADVTGVQSIITPFVLVLVLVIFYFIDSSILAARRSDPLLRETLRWTRSRYLLWVLVFFLVAASAAATELFSDTLQNNSFGFAILTGAPFFAVLGLGLVALPISATRSRDGTLRTHFGWFGLFVAFLLAFVITVAPAPSLNFTTGNFTFFNIADFQVAFVCMIVAGYCLYRSARSLAPLNRISLD